MTKEERKTYKGKSIVGNPRTNIEYRTGTIVKVKKDETLTIVFDDNPKQKNEGWLFEEVTLV